MSVFSGRWKHSISLRISVVGALKCRTTDISVALRSKRICVAAIVHLADRIWHCSTERKTHQRESQVIMQPHSVYSKVFNVHFSRWPFFPLEDLIISSSSNLLQWCCKVAFYAVPFIRSAVQFFQPCWKLRGLLHR